MITPSHKLIPFWKLCFRPTQVTRLNMQLTVLSVMACGKQEFNQIDIIVPFGLKLWEFKSGLKNVSKKKTPSLTI